jgi:hypothetical protein
MKAAPIERLFDFMRSTAQRNATTLRNGDGEIATSEANAETLRTLRSAEKKVPKFVTGNKDAGEQ